MDIIFDLNDLKISHVKCDEIKREIDGKYLLAYGFERNNLKDVEKKYGELVVDFNHENAKKIFAGGYFIALFDIEKKEVFLLRDISGIKTGYYGYDETSSTLYISTNMHYVASMMSTDLSKLYTDFLLYQQFIPDGYTIYEDVHELEIGTLLKFNITGGTYSKTRSDLPISFTENNFSEEENISLLRDKIIVAHEELIGNNNIVYLSGGIDSCAMLASLHNICPNNGNTISFKIKGTTQDETLYANKVAKYLGYKLEIIETSPNDCKLIANYEDDIMSVNNPIIGNWIYRMRGTINGNEHYFAGQDTRLHTPSVNGIDKWVISNISKGKISDSCLKKWIISLYENFAYIFKFYNSPNRRIKYSHLLLSALDYKLFLLRRKFQVDPLKYKSWKYDLTNFNSIADYYQLDLKSGMSEREIFNRIVKLKWQEQYTDDIRYMVDMGRLVNGFMMMPFYQDELNLFESTIPWNYANKEIDGLDGFKNKRIKVNKYILRKAFEAELPWDIMVRAKAVSVSGHLMLNGALGNKIIEIIKNDLLSPDSFCKRFGHEYKARQIIAKQSKWQPKDTYFLIYANYLGALCIYYKKNILKRRI